MKAHTSKMVIIALLTLIVGIPFALRPIAQTTRAITHQHADAQRLIIITPHNEQIRHEFARAFNAWRASQNLPPVIFDWRSSGGTSELRRQVLDQLSRLAAEGAEDDGLGIDLFFGGGDYEHNQLKAGVVVHRHGQPIRIAATVPINLSDERLLEVFPEPTIGGEPLYDPARHWVGTALSSFGIVYNRDVLDMLNLDPPQTWADMTDPRYQSWLAMADPAHSGSIAATYHIILRRLGWHEGWHVLRDIFANARYFSASASKVPVDVSAGNAAAGMCIDFYGRYQAGAIGTDRVGYVDPPFMTAITADPISILRGAPNQALAEQFIDWLLSEQAQQLWQHTRQSAQGPEQFELRRMPIRRDLYTPAEAAHWTDPEINPFAISTAVYEVMPSFYSAIGPLAHAMAIDVHADLLAARQALEHTPDDHPNKQEMIARYYAMPPELTLNWPEPLQDDWQVIARNPNHPQYRMLARTLAGFFDQVNALFDARQTSLEQRVALRLEWTLFFRDQYRQVVRLARE